MVRWPFFAAALALAAPRASAQPERAPELNDLDRGIDDLSTDIQKTEVRLQHLLDEAIGSANRPGLVVTLGNRLGAHYRIVAWRISVDGTELALDGRQTLRSALPPGRHTVDIQLDLVGDGLGVFPYLDGYRFSVRSSLDLAFGDSAPIRLDVVAHERGDVTTPFVERPALRIEER